MRFHSLKTSTAAALVALVSTLAWSGCGTGRHAAVSTAPPTPAEVRAIAEEGYIYGLPLVMNYAVNYEYWVATNSSQYKCPFNRIFSESRVFTYKDTAVVTPNSDTPYSFACLDLRAEPYVISVPAVERGRYYSVQMTDWNTFNFGYIGSRTTGTEPGSFLVVGPDWDGRKPAGIKEVFHATTQFALLIFRTQLLGSEDMPNVQRVQAGYQARPLSAYLGRPAPPASPALNFPPITAALARERFFDYLDFVLHLAPAGPEEKAIRARLARLGVGPGKTGHHADLPAALRAEVAAGMKAGEARVEQRVSTIGTSVNGWHVGSAFGDRHFYRGDWLLRAAAAKAGIYGNNATEAMYPIAKTDATGQPLDTGRHKYTITFPAGQLPPVNAFWSVTMYDGRTQLLIENPINRYLINSPMVPGMKKNADGSMTLYIQHASPGPDRESNWLPAPNGPAFVVMRLYWPKTGAPSILPPGQGSWKPPGIVVAD